MQTKRPTRVESNILGRKITPRSTGQLPHFFHLGSLDSATPLQKSTVASDRRPVQCPWSTRFSSDSTRVSEPGYNEGEIPSVRVEAGSLLSQVAQTRAKKKSTRNRNEQPDSEGKTQTSNPMQQSVASSVTQQYRGTLLDNNISGTPEVHLEDPSEGHEVSGFQSFPRHESFSSTPESRHYFPAAGCQMS